MEKMDASHHNVDVKLAGIKRKAETANIWKKDPQPREVPQIYNGFGKLPVPGCFLKLQETLEICRQSEYVLESIPPGKKINVFCIIDDSLNALKRERDEPPNYSDDCGKWKSKEGGRTFYVQIIDGITTCMKLKDNLYYKDSHAKGRSSLPPLKPQPDPNTLIKVSRRIYTSARSGYKKRITTLSGSSIKNVALIEYSDAATFEHVHEAQEKVVHNVEKDTSIGVNSKHVLEKKKVVHNAENSTNIALSPQHVPETEVQNVEKNVNAAVNSKHVLETKKKVVHNVVKGRRGRPRLNRVHNAVKRLKGRPRLSRVHNAVTRPKGRLLLNKIKHSDMKTNRHTFNKIQTQSFPRSSKQASLKPLPITTGMQKDAAVYNEDFLMISMLEENPSVQEVMNRKSKSPCIILYNNQQFSDMKRNLECESVLGVDCTHKFGNWYITLTVYQNSRALHKDTNEPLLFLGPVFLHWDKEFLTYVFFFTHIMDKLEGIEPNVEVKLGNNVGLPLFKALKFSFPTSPYILDYHHLKKTVSRELLSIVSGKPKACSAILDRIFGEEGIMSSSCLSAFENEFSDLACFFDEFPHLKSYFDGLKLFLYPYVCEPHQRGISQKLWVNGNDEVLNDQLHTMFKCEESKLPEIVEKICAISQMQILKLKDV